MKNPAMVPVVINFNKSENKKKGNLTSERPDPMTTSNDINLLLNKMIPTKKIKPTTRS